MLVELTGREQKIYDPNMWISRCYERPAGVHRVLAQPTGLFLLRDSP